MHITINCLLLSSGKGFPLFGKLSNSPAKYAYELKITSINKCMLHMVIMKPA